MSTALRRGYSDYTMVLIAYTESLVELGLLGDACL
jgi:aspartokinase